MNGSSDTSVSFRCRSLICLDKKSTNNILKTIGTYLGERNGTSDRKDGTAQIMINMIVPFITDTRIGTAIEQRKYLN